MSTRTTPGGGGRAGDRMRLFIDEHGHVREGGLAAIACELGIPRPDFDVATWVVKALG